MRQYPGSVRPASLALLVVAASFALSGCGAPEVDPEPAATTEEADPAISEAADFPDFFSTCTDQAGDGAQGIDISEASLHSDGTLVYATATLAEPIQPSDVGEFGYLVSAFSEDGETGYQFGTKFLDGSEIANFVFDMGAASQENVTNGAVFADGMISVRYPVDLLSDLGPGFHWYGVVTLDGADIDSCGDTDAPVVTEPES